MEKRDDRSRAILQGSAGGVLAGLSFLQSGFLLMPIALAMLWPASRYPVAGFLFGVFSVLVSHSWLLALHPLTWVGVPSFLSLPVALAIWLSCGLFSGCLVAIWSYLSTLFGTKEGRRSNSKEQTLHALFMSSLWGLAEVQLSHGPLFWIGLGATLLPEDIPLAGLARWIGSGGLAMVQLLIGWWIWRIFHSFRLAGRWRRAVFVGLSCLLMAHLLGWSLLRLEITPLSNSVAIWQPAIPTRTKFSQAQQIRLQEAFEKALDTAKEIQADWLVAPEGTLLAGQKLLAPSPLPLLTGGFRWVRGEQRSSLLFVPKGKREFSIGIDKHRLVPLGEWVPSWISESFKGLSAVGGVQPGAPARIFQWDGPPLAVAICYEITDGSSLVKAVEDGAEVLVSIANLDPYPISLHRQFLSLARLRSIETGRDLISVANTGPSALVSANGASTSLLPPFLSGIAKVEVHRYRQRTLYSIWHEMPLFVIASFSAMGIVWLRFRP